MMTAGCYGRMATAVLPVTVAVAVLATLAQSLSTPLPRTNIDPANRSYCPSVGCCTDRRDDCSVPFFDTMCYCDEFCGTHGDAKDCCPDFISYCKNGTVHPPLRHRSTTNRPTVDLLTRTTTPRTRDDFGPCSPHEFREILVANMNDENEILKKIGYLESRKSDITKEIEKYMFTLKRIRIERCLLENAKTKSNGSCCEHAKKIGRDVIVPNDSDE